MNSHAIVFTPYPFTVGQRIVRQRNGKNEDWDVIAVTDEEVTVKCPFHGNVLTWKRNHFWSTVPGSA
ncbi:MAG: hypothetical protein JXO49_02480 [Deltaproteobacteria bacterium]|nr:hypothetical protein [Candidatus Anaeroferrophillus wilburensis]MBN2888194.1 hypothetical protein [Deltaproteobacteria bacterium]